MSESQTGERERKTWTLSCFAQGRRKWRTSAAVYLTSDDENGSLLLPYMQVDSLSLCLLSSSLHRTLQLHPTLRGYLSPRFQQRRRSRRHMRGKKNGIETKHALVHQANRRSTDRAPSLQRGFTSLTQSFSSSSCSSLFFLSSDSNILSGDNMRRRLENGSKFGEWISCVFYSSAPVSSYHWGLCLS